MPRNPDGAGLAKIYTARAAFVSRPSRIVYAYTTGAVFTTTALRFCEEPYVIRSVSPREIFDVLRRSMECSIRILPHN